MAPHSPFYGVRAPLRRAPWAGVQFWEGHGEKGSGTPRPHSSLATGADQAGGLAPTHLWVQTVWHSRACGRKVSRHAGEKGTRQGVRASAGLYGPPPCLKVGVPCSPQPGPGGRLTSAWPPGVSVLLQRSHLRQNLCQSLPRELTFSAGGGRGPQDQPCTLPAPQGPHYPSSLSHPHCPGDSTSSTPHLPHTVSLIHVPEPSQSPQPGSHGAGQGPC